MSVKFRETVRESSDNNYNGPGRFQDGPSRFDDGTTRYRDGPRERESERFQEDVRYQDRGDGDRFQERFEETTTRVDGDRGDRGREFGDRTRDRLRGFRERARENIRDFGDKVRDTTDDVRGETRERDFQSREYQTRDGQGREGQGRGFEGGQSEEHHFGKYQDKHHKIKHPTLHRWGEAVTKGEGAGGYLQAYLRELEKNPLRTKMLTSGSLAGVQELLASWIAQDRNQRGNFFTSRVPKMAIYGALISAPMGHFLVKLIHFLFAHRTSLKAKVFQILFSNLIVSPIQNTIYLVAMAIIAGARNFHQIRATVRAGFIPVMRVSWIASPVCLAFAQQFLPEETWVPFFNVVAFAIGTYINVYTKKKRLAALRRRREQEQYGRTTSTDYRPGGPGMGPGMPGAPSEYARESRSEYDVRSTRGQGPY